MKLKYFLISAALMTMGQAVATLPATQAISQSGKTDKSGKSDKTDKSDKSELENVPAYTFVGKDSICQIFIYSPDPTQGLHLAYLTEDERWVDVGQLCASDYGPWGAEKKMYNPFVLKANDGTWRALWSVNDHSPQFAVAYSEDLVTWRPQDYPIVKERGVLDVAAYQMDDGNIDIYLKTHKGKRYVQATKDFRTFQEDSLEATADEILWQRDTATIDGKCYKGCDFEVPALHLAYIRSWFKALAEENRENSRQMPKTDADLQALGYGQKGDVEAQLTIHPQKTHRISDKLIGIFFEDISRAADGGLCSELLQNGDFEYNKEDHKHQWNATTAWTGVQLAGSAVGKSGAAAVSTVGKAGSEASAVISTENGVSQNNPHYAILGSTPIYNIGWDGIAIKRGAAIEGKEGKHQAELYNVSLYARCIDGKQKQLTVALVDKDGQPIAEAKVKVVGAEWAEYKAQLAITDKYKGMLPSDTVESSNQASSGASNDSKDANASKNSKDANVSKDLKNGKNIRFAIIPKGDNKVAVDLVSLKPQDTYKGHGLRRDLAEAIADLKPRFVRFPGGCMLHGQGIDNIYHWKESVGPQKDRKPAYNIWGYHQTRQLGFYEYFQWCEDMGAEPLPVLAAGVPCQNSVANKQGVAGQQGGIPMSQMPQYIQDVLDLVEWANGDPATSKWAKMRANAGHPAPFNLKMIGIGNEDLISTDFEQRYLMICKAVKEKYPQIEVVGTVGPFHFPSSDYIEGWKIAKENHRYIDAVDEHYYEQPGWFINHQDYYDQYDRKAPKVYLGEYASRGRDALDNALAEGIHLCNVERNGDVVEMASYAPLLSKDGYSNWSPDMIYFNNNNVRASESYKMQRMFGQHAGDVYVASELQLPQAIRKYVATSVVKNTKTGKTWLKVVNALPRTLKIRVDGLGNRNLEVKGRSAEVYEL